MAFLSLEDSEMYRKGIFSEPVAKRTCAASLRKAERVYKDFAFCLLSTPRGQALRAMAPDSPIQIDDTSSLSSLDSSHNDTPQTSSAIQAPRRVHNAFVLLPTLSSEKKLLYKPLSKSSFGLDFEARVDEIIGEYREGKALYYFARYDGGIARKVWRV